MTYHVEIVTLCYDGDDYVFIHIPEVINDCAEINQIACVSSYAVFLVEK